MDQFLNDPVFAAFAIGATLLAGLSKGGFGGGLGFIGVLALAQVSSPTQAVAIMLPILCVMDLIGAWAYRKDWDRPSMKVLGIGCAIGTLIGMLTFKWMDDQLIRLTVGAIAIAFFVDFFRSGGEKAAARVFSKPVGYVLGTIGGFTSFIIHAGLPPVAMYLLPQRLDRRIHVGTIVILFAFINYLKILPYWWLGLFTMPNLTTALILMPLAPVGMLIGIRFNTLIPQKIFMRLSYTILFVLGVRMMYEGLSPYFV
tara:strand:+ start:203 stop:970 length:768 start_codon:yes stop_codon:yes gene_type:complete